MAPRTSIPRAVLLLGIITTMLAGLFLAPAAHADPVNTPLFPNPAVPLDGAASVSFFDPMDPAITSYQYTLFSDENHWTNFVVKPLDDGSGNAGGTIPNLVNGQSYSIRLRGYNSADGGGPASDPVQVTPGRPLAPELNPTPTDRGAVITFSPPNSGGLPLRTTDPYEVTVTPAEPGITVTVDATADPVTVTIGGLTNTVSYDVKVVAVNTEGAGAAATTTVTPDAAPLPPTNVRAAPGNGQVSVTFDPSASNGTSAVSTYNVSAVDHPEILTNCDGVSECILTGLTNGTTYTIAVSASNNSPTASDAALSNPVTPKGPPLAATGLAVVGATASTLTVSFVPAFAAGAPINRYAISVDGGKTFTTVPYAKRGSRLVATAARLRSGTIYRLAVRAQNAEGVGPSSRVITGVTVPSAIGRPVVRVGTSMVLASWRPSRESTTTGYRVYASPGHATCTTYDRYDTSCLLGAVPGTKTRFVVVAINAGGRSGASSASSAVRARAVTVPRRLPAVPGGLSTGRTTKVKSGHSVTVSGRGFLAGSLVTLVAYRSKRVIVGYTVASAAGSIGKSVRMPSGGTGRVTFVAFGVTPGGTSKAMSRSLTRTR